MAVERDTKYLGLTVCSIGLCRQGVEGLWYFLPRGCIWSWLLQLKTGMESCRGRLAVPGKLLYDGLLHSARCWGKPVHYPCCFPWVTASLCSICAHEASFFFPHLNCSIASAWFCMRARGLQWSSCHVCMFLRERLCPFPFPSPTKLVREVFVWLEFVLKMFLGGIPFCRIIYWVSDIVWWGDLQSISECVYVFIHCYNWAFLLLFFLHK